jgi:hypothetical protein
MPERLWIAGQLDEFVHFRHRAYSKTAGGTLSEGGVFRASRT